MGVGLLPYGKFANLLHVTMGADALQQFYVGPEPSDALKIAGRQGVGEVSMAAAYQAMLDALPSTGQSQAFRNGYSDVLQHPTPLPR